MSQLTIVPPKTPQVEGYQIGDVLTTQRNPGDDYLLCNGASSVGLNLSEEYRQMNIEQVLKNGSISFSFYPNVSTDSNFRIYDMAYLNNKYYFAGSQLFTSTNLYSTDSSYWTKTYVDVNNRCILQKGDVLVIGSDTSGSGTTSACIYYSRDDFSTQTKIDLPSPATRCIGGGYLGNYLVILFGNVLAYSLDGVNWQFNTTSALLKDKFFNYNNEVWYFWDNTYITPSATSLSVTYITTPTTTAPATIAVPIKGDTASENYGEAYFFRLGANEYYSLTTNAAGKSYMGHSSSFTSSTSAWNIQNVWDLNGFNQATKINGKYYFIKQVGGSINLPIVYWTSQNPVLGGWSSVNLTGNSNYQSGRGIFEAQDGNIILYGMKLGFIKPQIPSISLSSIAPTYIKIK